MIRATVEHAVHRASVLALCPPIEKIADVDDEDVLFCWDGKPGARWWVEDLQAFLVGLLEEEGEAAEIGVCAGYICKYKLVNTLARCTKSKEINRCVKSDLKDQKRERKKKEEEKKKKRGTPPS